MRRERRARENTHRQFATPASRFSAGDAHPNQQTSSIVEPNPKSQDTVSWYQPHLEASLSLIERTGAGLSSSIIDVGGGESTLADDLVSRGYQNVTVLDISETAINVSKQRMGEAAEHVHWLVADVLAMELKPRAYDVWH